MEPQLPPVYNSNNIHDSQGISEGMIKWKWFVSFKALYKCKVFTTENDCK